EVAPDAGAGALAGVLFIASIRLLSSSWAFDKAFICDTASSARESILDILRVSSASCASE
ncbi:hypothetical protein, partial [Klebsiella pneumoniae]|uniref:hypothetical protein n=1 Tax=Klebsiella pneumoniae TaxID=573 RepID=UPI001C68EC7E